MLLKESRGTHTNNFGLEAALGLLLYLALSVLTHYYLGTIPLS